MIIYNKKAFIAAALLALPLSALAQSADATQESRYWSVQAGMNSLSHWPAMVDFGGPQADASLGLERGAQFGAAWGKQYDKARYELEYQHGRFDIDSVTISSRTEQVSASGKYDVLTANALRSVAINPDWSVYAGLGIGIGRVSLPGIRLASGCKCISEASKSRFTYLVRTGAEYRLSNTGFGFVQLSWMKLPGSSSGAMPSVTYPKRGVGTLGFGYRGQYR